MGYNPYLNIKIKIKIFQKSPKEKSKSVVPKHIPIYNTSAFYVSYSHSYTGMINSAHVSPLSQLFTSKSKSNESSIDTTVILTSSGILAIASLSLPIFICLSPTIFKFLYEHVATTPASNYVVPHAI